MHNKLDPRYSLCYNRCQPSLKVKEKAPIDKYTRLNDAIRAPKLRVIDADGQQLGVLSKQEAVALARSQELDLVEISPNTDPPVAKIVDWGKYKYERTKLAQKSKRNAKAVELKQMRFGLKISDHDLGVKLKKVDGFLESGHKVKLTVVYRGREQAHKEIGFTLAQRVIDGYGERIVVDQSPSLAGRQLNFVIRSNPRSKPNAQTKDS